MTLILNPSHPNPITSSKKTPRGVFLMIEIKKYLELSHISRIMIVIIILKLEESVLVDLKNFCIN